MKLSMKVLSPVHISSGSDLSPSEYYVDKEAGRVNVVDMEKLFLDPGFNAYRESFIREAGTSRYLGDIIRDEKLLSRHLLYSIPATADFRNQNYINIKSFIKSAGRPYVPGSSIKGAIISALIYQALKEIARNESIELNQRTRYTDLLDRAYRQLSKEGHLNLKRDRFLNLLSVSDSNLLNPEDSLQAEVCEVIGARTRGRIPVRYECLKEGVTLEFELKSVNCKYSETQILDICHDFYKKVAAKEGVDSGQEPYLLRLGQGSSRYAVSLLILAEELNIRNYGLRPARTKKRLMRGTGRKEMGFVQLKQI
jgi:CRISPR-associated protein Csm5